jgi:hypothetical protein
VAAPGAKRTHDRPQSSAAPVTERGSGKCAARAGGRSDDMEQADTQRPVRHESLEGAGAGFSPRARLVGAAPDVR